MLTAASYEKFVNFHILHAEYVASVAITFLKLGP